jgi:predicted nuclease of predicted toxin-antitoxin system
LAGLLQSFGHNAIHTLELPEGNNTSDEALCMLAATEQKVLVTKDGDFVDSFLLRHLPPKLLLVAIGNISNKELLVLFRASLPAITHAFSYNLFIEIDRHGLTIHENV